jgi:hypothetical protein
MGALIAAAGITAAGAVAGGAMAMSSADKAASATAAAGKSLKQTQAKATDIYEDNISDATDVFIQQQQELKNAISELDVNARIPDYNLKDATLEGINAANAMTANTIRQIQNVSGRNPTEVIQNALSTLGQWEANLQQQNVQLQQGIPLIQQQEAVVSEMMRGQLPQVTLDQISRSLAERGGAGFSMQAAGQAPFIQSPQAMLAESIRQSSEARIQQGLSYAPNITAQRTQLAGATSSLAGASANLSNVMGNWMGIANSFITNAAVPMELSLAGRSQDISKLNTEFNQLGMIGDINASTFGAQSQYATNLYNAATGQAMTAYDVAQQNAATNLAAEQQTAQMVSQGAAATGSAITAGVGAYNQYTTAKAGGGSVGPGGFDYTKAYGPATYGSASPGMGNFDYGSGTGA